MKRNRYALILGVLVCLTGAVAAFDVTETTDYPGGLSFGFDPSIGTLDPGSNTVSGSLSGNCVFNTTFSNVDCNPGIALGGDSQDSFLLTVPTGYQLTSLAVTTSAVSGPAGLSVSISLDSPTANVLFTPFLSPLPGTTANLLSGPVPAGVYAISMFGQQASAAGAYSVNWSVAMTLQSVAITPAQSVTNLINLISNPNSGLGLSSGQINSLTDKLNNALASIQAGLNAQAVNQLQAFINSVQSNLKTGKISGQTASTLISAANAIIAVL